MLWLFLLLSAPAQAAFEVALVQYNADLHFADYETNRAELTRFAEQAVAHGSKLIVFPEGSLYGYSSASRQWCANSSSAKCKDVAEVAETIPGGKSSQYWEAFAKKHQVFVLFNLPERAGDAYYNTTAVIGPQGYVTEYRKQQLYVTDELYARPSDRGPVTFDTPAGPFGLLICMDGNFPSLYQDYKRMGVNHLIIPMDWDEDPNGLHGARPARTFFQEMARTMEMDLYVSDVSAWDGTGAYLANETARTRNGLPSQAIGKNGISYHLLPSL